MMKTCATCGHGHECEAGEKADKTVGKQDTVGTFPEGKNSGSSAGIKTMAGKMAMMMSGKKK